MKPAPLSRSTTPDLSHLTLEERRIIEGVLSRQREEERKDIEAMKKTSAKPVIAEPESASNLSQAAKSPAVGMNGSKQAGLTSPLGNVLSNIVSTAVNAVAMNRDEGTDALCEVCSKTKFADGTSHQCVTCKRRTCARCGYQMNNGVNQLQWLCTPCAQMANEFPPAPSTQISSRRWSRDDVLRDTKLTRGSGLQASSLKRVPELSVGEKKRKLPVIVGVASDRYVLEDQARFDNNLMIRSSSMEQQDYEQLQPRGITRRSIYTPRQPTSDPRQQHQYWQKFDPSPQSVYRQGSSRPQRSEHYAREAAMRQYYSGAHFPYPEPYEQELGTESLLSDYADSPSVGNMRPRGNGVYEGGTLMSQDRSDGSETDPGEEAYERTSTHLANYTADVGRAHSGEYDTDLYESHDEVTSPKHSPNSQLYGMSHAGSDVDHSYYGSHGSHTHRSLNARYESHPLKDGFFRQQYPGLAADHLASHRHDPFKHPGEDDLTSLPQSPQSMPFNWTASSDGKRLVGHMIFRRQGIHRSKDFGALIGFKVSGGRRTHSGRLGAFITCVKPNSQAHLLGRLEAGDEVLEWNGQSLRDLPSEQVSAIIQQSETDSQLELIVQRNIREASDILEEGHRSERLPIQDLGGSASPSSVYQSENSYDDQASPPTSSVQLGVRFDQIREQLIVHLLSASGLPAGYNTYCRICLLPGRDEMKYSTMISQNDNPQWNQIFRFNGYDEQDFAQADLEVTLWTCEPDSSEQTFIGEVIIDLSVADLTGLLYRYPLQLEPSSEFSSEAATPVLDVAAASDPRVALSRSRSPRGTQQSVTGRMAPTHESPHLVPAKVGEDLTHQATAYDETDESTHDTGVLSSHMSNRVDARQMRRHFPLGSPRVGKSYRGHEPQLHSDVSEYSDISDVSRISIPTARSDRSRNRQSDNLAHFTTPYHQASAMGSNSELLPESYSPVRREYDLPEKSSNEPRVFHHGPTFPADDERRQQKESSSSECGSILMESSDGRDVGYREKPKEFHPIPPEQHNRVKNGSGWKTRPSISHKFSTVLGRSGKSSSTSNLDKKRGTRFQRSEEVLPFLQEDRLTDSVSETAGSSGSLLPVKPGSRVANEALHRQGERDDRNSSRNSPTLSRNESHVGEFVEGLGPGQLVGRQVLGMPCLGEIQLSFFDRKGRLEIEVIRARGLQHKNANKPIPAPYVKLHLLEGKISVEKLRTTTAPRRTLDPLYQQQLAFSTPYHGKVIQVSVWGEYGRMDKKVFLGMCEVVLDDLDLKSVVFGWYKLFGIIASNAHHRHQSRNLHQSHSGLSVPDAEFNSDIAKKESRSTLSKGKASSFIDRRRKRTAVEK